MYKLFVVLMSLGICIVTNAQQSPAQPQRQQSPVVPPFHIMKVDSSSFYTNSDLKKHHETLIMYFSPECDHCKHQTRDLIADMDKLKDVEIVMATYFSFNEMKSFYENFHIAKYSNIKMGRDENYQIPSHYVIHSLPFLALYDKKGKLLATFEGNQKVSTLLEAFNK